LKHARINIYNTTACCHFYGCFGEPEETFAFAETKFMVGTVN
jgi:hypothetical protein